MANYVNPPSNFNFVKIDLNSTSNTLALSNHVVGILTGSFGSTENKLPFRYLSSPPTSLNDKYFTVETLNKYRFSNRYQTIVDSVYTSQLLQSNSKNAWNSSRSPWAKHISANTAHNQPFYDGGPTPPIPPENKLNIVATVNDLSTLVAAAYLPLTNIRYSRFHVLDKYTGQNSNVWPKIENVYDFNAVYLKTSAISAQNSTKLFNNANSNKRVFNKFSELLAYESSSGQTVAQRLNALTAVKAN